jgi:hypothetical protein
MKTLNVTKNKEIFYNNIPESVYYNKLNLPNPCSVTDSSHQQIISLNNKARILMSLQKEGYTHILDEYHDIIDENISRHIDNILDHISIIQYDIDNII